MSAISPVLENAATSEPKTLKMSFEKWLAWDYEGGLTEWVDGEVQIYISASATHQTLIQFLSAVLGIFVQWYGLGNVLTAPYPMRAIREGNGREPDLMFVATDHLERVTATQLVGAADLVVEVSSEESVARDRDDKFIEYQEAGVREYWILDPRSRRRRADFYVLDDFGVYQPVPLRTDGTFHSSVVTGFWLKVDWLWDQKMSPFTALTEIVGSEKMIGFVREKK